MNANIDNLPGWAREALRDACAPWIAHHKYPEGYAERVAGRWSDIESDVLPKLPESLSETGKNNFFRLVFGEGLYGTVEAPGKARDAVRRLNDIREAIAETAQQLADLIADRGEIIESGLATDDGMPGLFDLIEQLAGSYRWWDNWRSLSEKEMQRLLALEATMSQPVPSLCDVLLALAQRLDDSPPAQASEPAFRSRQTSQANYVRQLIDAISRRSLHRRADGRPRDDIAGGDAACLPADFILPDSAMATLVSVLLDLPPGEPSAEAVRAVRLSRQQRPDGDGVSPKNRTTTKQRRRGDPISPTNPAAHLFSGYWGAKPHS